MTMFRCKPAGALTLLTVFVFLLAPAHVAAEPGGSAVGGGNSYSVGLGLGDPTGIEFGFWFENENWLDLGLGVGGFSSAVLYGTYHWKLVEFDNRNSDVLNVALSLGLGGLIGGGNNDYWGGRGYWGDRRFDDDNRNVRFGARVPFGVELLFVQAPVSLFFQIGPQFTNYFPDDILTGQIGVRFHFGGRGSGR